MNSNTLNITIEVDDKGTPKIRLLGKEMETASRKGEKGFERTNKSLGDFNQTAAGTSRMIKGIISGWAAMKFVQMSKQTVALADDWTLMENKLKLVTESERELAEVQQGLYDLSERSHAAYSTSVDLYSRFAKATEKMGTSQQELLRITETLNKATLISGATQQEAAASLLQLSQGMASGVLRGEEFNSVTENSSRIAKILADHLKVDIGELRNMAAEGKITSRIMMEAFSNAAGTIDEEFSQMEVTVSQAMTDLKTLLGDVINDANEASGGTSDIAKGIQELADTIDTNRVEIIGFFGAILSGASKAVEIVGNLGQSIAGFAAVGEGRLSFFELASMDAQELGIWLKANNDEISRFDFQIQESEAKIQSLRDQFAISPDAIAQRRSAIATEREHLETLRQSRDMVIAMGAAVDDTYGDYGGALVETTAATDKQIEAEEKQAKVIRITTDERYESLQIVKEHAREAIAAQKAEAEAAQELAAQQADAYRAMYDDMEHSADEDFDHRKGLLDEIYQKYKDLKVDQLKLDAWYNSQVEDLEKERLLRTGDFFDGINLALKKSGDEMETWAERGYDAALKLRDGLESTLSDWLQNVLMGEFDNVGQAWDSLWTTMLSKMIEIIAEMAAAWAAAEVADVASSFIFHDGTMNAGGDYNGQALLHDEIPAVLQKGEIVIPREQSDRIRDALDGATSIDQSTVSSTFDSVADALGADLSDPDDVASVGGFFDSFFGNLASEFGRDAVMGGAGVATGLDAGSVMDAITGGANIASNITNAALNTTMSALGLDQNAQTAGKLGGALSGLLGALSGPAAAAAALGIAVGVDGLMDLADVRDLESVRDQFENTRAQQAIDFGLPSAIAEVFGHFAGRADFAAMEAQIEAQAEAAVETGGYSGDLAGEEAQESGALDTFDSDMGNIGDDPGDMAARYGGIFSGPDQGYPVELHGTEAVIPLKNGTIPVDLQGADKKGSETVSIIEEIRALRADLRAGNYQIAKNTGQMSRTIKRWESAGMPEERVLQ